MLGFDKSDRAVPPAAFCLQRPPRIRKFPLCGDQTGGNDVRLLTRRRRFGHSVSALLQRPNLSLEPLPLQACFAQLLLQSHHTAVAGALRLLNLGLQPYQLRAHLGRVAALRLRLRCGVLGGGGLGVGTRSRLVHFLFESIDVLLFHCNLGKCGLRIAAVRDHFAQQGVTLADEVPKRLEPLEDGQFSG